MTTKFHIILANTAGKLGERFTTAHDDPELTAEVIDFIQEIGSLRDGDTIRIVEVVGLTKGEAEMLALNDKHYRPRQMGGEWIVWDDVSDHEVTFDEAAIQRAKINDAIRFTSE